MFLRFTQKYSRPGIGIVLALLMLFAPVFIAATVESAQKKKAAPTPTPKKKATPTPKKNSQAKTKPTPKKTPATKKRTQTASKNKTSTKVAPKNTSKTAAKNSKAGSTKKSKQTVAANNKKPSKNTKNDKNAKTSDKNKSSKTTKPTTAAKTRTKPTPSKTTKPATTKTTPKTTTASKTADKTTKADSAEVPQVIVSGFSVPVRSQAKSDAPTVSNVKLGTVLRVTEKNPAWYKVQYSTDGKTSTGWISANSVNDLNAADKTEMYRRIVERNYQPQMDFASATEIYEFLSNVDSQLDSSDKAAELELKRLLALRSALKTIPIDKKEMSPYVEFIRARETEIVESEPSGELLVVSSRFWDLSKKHKRSAVSDTIAWEAANNPIPGECAGYVTCYLFDMRMRFGEYLNLHPDGKNAPQALIGMTDYLSPIVADSQQKKIYNSPTDVTDRAEFNNLLAELRTIVARLPFVEKEKTLLQLRQIAEAYR